LLGFKEIIIIAVLMLVIWGLKNWNSERKKKLAREQRKRGKHVQTDRYAD
jgi:hypothetical protein